MVVEEFYAQANEFLHNSDPESATLYISKLKKIGEFNNIEYQRLERMCLDQFYYLLMEALNRRDYNQCERYINSYQSLKNDARIKVCKEKLLCISKTVNPEKGGDSQGLSKKYLYLIMLIIVIVGIGSAIFVHLDDNKNRIKDEQIQDDIRLADSIAAMEAAAAEATYTDEDAAAFCERKRFEESQNRGGITYRGMINEKYEIVLNITIDGNNVTGSYYYVKNGSNYTLELTGKIEGLEMQIWEHNSKGENTGVFEGEMNDDEFSGVFTNYKGIRMPFLVRK